MALENVKALESLSERVKNFYDNRHLHHAADAVMAMLHIANQMFDHHQPWQLCKSDDPDSIRQLEAVISLALESVRVAALLLHPMAPRLTSNILDTLQVPTENRSWEDTKPLHMTNSMTGERIVSQNVVAFKRIKI